MVDDFKSRGGSPWGSPPGGGNGSGRKGPTPPDIDEIIRSKNIEQVSDAGILSKEAQKILEKHPKEVQDYKNGKDKLMGFFVGQIMKEMKGKANPKVLNEILNKLLKE